MIDNLEFSEYVTYMRSLAEQHLAVLHSPQSPKFFRINIDDALDKITALKSPMVLLQSFEGKIAGPNDDQLYDQIRCGFMILKTVKTGMHSEQDAVLNHTRAIMRDFISRLRHDKKCGTPRWLIHLNVQSITYYKVGPLLIDKFGWLCEFTVDTAVNLRYDDSKWL